MTGINSLGIYLEIILARMVACSLCSLSLSLLHFSLACIVFVSFIRFAVAGGVRMTKPMVTGGIWSLILSGIQELVHCGLLLNNSGPCQGKD